VAIVPIPGIQPPILGTFVCRGTRVVAVDLAGLHGVRRQPALDAQIAILSGVPVVGLLCDGVRALHYHPVLRTAGRREVPGWAGSGLVAGLCTAGGEVLALLDPAPIVAAVREALA
jgi:purine-binding chemotaxis protein CheW